MLNKQLTRSEEDLMEIFWQYNTPLTSVEILNIARDRSWNGNYLHVMLRSLQKKGMIKICGTTQYGKQYARQFEPALTRAEYAADLIYHKGLADSISQVTVALVEKSDKLDKKLLISELQEIIDKMKSE